MKNSDTLLVGFDNKHGDIAVLIVGRKEPGEKVQILKMDSPNFKQFCDELAPFNEMEHEVELMTAKYDDAAGNLSGEEILAIDWMLED